MKIRSGARLLPLGQIDAEYGLPIDTLDKLIKTGALPVVELPHVRRRFVDRQDLERCIEEWKTR